MTKSSILQPVTVGLVTAFVGYASSFAVILKGLTAVGASDAAGGFGIDGAVDRDGGRRSRSEPQEPNADFRGVVDAGRRAAGRDRGGRRAAFPRRSAPLSSSAS